MPKRTQDQRLWIDLALDLLSKVELDAKGDVPIGAGVLFKETRLALFPEAAKQPTTAKQPQAAPRDPIKALLENRN